MPATPQHGRALFLALALPAALAPNPAGVAQEPARPVALAEAPAADLTRAVIGARQCANCHAHPENYKTDLAAGRLLCRMNEFPIWDQKDKHKTALKILTEPRARRMGDLLGIADVARHPACVSCHGVIIPEGVEPQFLDDPVAEGVTCIACHGGYQEWIVTHTIPKSPKWRNLTRAQKQRDFGMIDLWDPVVRTRTCASCHVGNAEGGKIVTHAMYAAGHPPLPGLEVATFSDAQPRHWQYLREKSAEVQQALRVDPDRLEQTELVAVNGLVALNETLKLFVAQAEGDGLVREPPTAWPDFARFDCLACHHDLEAPGWLGWRQRRGFPGAPGRPMIPSWPASLVALGLEATNPATTDAQLDARTDPFTRALGARPFGDTRRSVEAARSLVRWSDDAIAEFSGSTIDRASALRLLRRLGDLARAGTPDYATARQLAWACRAIAREIEPDGKVPPALESLDRELLLTLPSSGRQEPIEKSLSIRLKAAADYQPDRFKARFAELVGQLPEK